jgi:hypothetical protein
MVEGLLVQSGGVAQLYGRSTGDARNDGGDLISR